jgi:dolichol-phosphate mannosyltransferase
MRPKISVILPTYNERENIGRLVERIFRSVNDSLQIIVVDDDSPDGTWKVVQEIAERDHRVRLLRRVGRRGLTSALVEGISLARGEIVVWMDCDFSMPPEVVPRLVREIGAFDIVVGSRYVEGGKDARDSPFRIVTSRLFDRFGSLVLQSPVKDITSGFVAAKKELFDNISLSGRHGDYCIDFLYRAVRRGFKVKEIPYTNMPRSMGKTKTNPNIFEFLKYGWIYTLTVLRLRFHGGS